MTRSLGLSREHPLSGCPVQMASSRVARSGLSLSSTALGVGGLLTLLAALTVQLHTGGRVVGLDWAVQRRVARLPVEDRHLAALFTFLGYPQVVLPLTVAVCLMVAFVRSSMATAVLAVVIAGVLTVTVLGLKAAIGRPGPSGTIVHGGAFPSGHTTTAIVCWSLFVLVAIPRRWRGRAAVAAAGVVALVQVGLVVGDFHWLSDVLAGDLLGTAIALASAWAVAYHLPPYGPTPRTRHIECLRTRACTWWRHLP